MNTDIDRLSGAAPLEDAIRAAIQSQGPMPFSRFMEWALYAPGLGYYEGKRPIGRQGDFYTSVSVGSLFGRLLARKFAAWIEENPLAPAQWIESGAHQGDLAADILDWFRSEKPALYSRLQYIIVEPSSQRQEWQAARLKDFADKVHWMSALPGARTVDGVIFSNELLDAMPFDRLRWNAAKRLWEEWQVGWSEGRFTWVVGGMRAELQALSPKVPPELAAVLPDGYTVEVSGAALAWWRTAALALRMGRLIAFDYGYGAEEQFAVHRLHGTARSYYRHQVSGDILSQPGGRDITAHVDFGAIQAAGEAAGLQTELFVNQGQFLTGIVAEAPLQNWTSSDSRQFQTLIHPEHLGRAFKILVQKCEPLRR